MKTLDEVILCLDGCGHIDCDDCPYHYEDEKIEVDDCAQVYNDALHYLKAFRDAKDTLEKEKDRYQEAVKNCETAENKYRKAEQDALKALDDWASRPVEENKKLVLTVDNPPLTWDELKTMEGKPVWVEGSAFAYGFWAIPYCFENSGGNEYVFMWGDQYWREEMRDADDGISWQAYRKERS